MYDPVWEPADQFLVQTVPVSGPKAPQKVVGGGQTNTQTKRHYVNIYEYDFTNEQILGRIIADFSQKENGATIFSIRAQYIIFMVLT